MIINPQTHNLVVKLIVLGSLVLLLEEVKKHPGYTLIEIDGKVLSFTIGDKTHPEIAKIERMWEEILRKIKPAGYTVSTADALFDIDQAEKENALYRHSEKLAIAYGIMKTKAHSSIRIVKNLESM